MPASRRRPSWTLTLIAPAMLSLFAFLALQAAPGAQAAVTAQAGNSAQTANAQRTGQTANTRQTAQRQNRTTVRLLPAAARRLGARNVRLISTGLARGRGQEVRLSVMSGNISRARAMLRQGGGFEIRARVPGRGVRSLKLTRLQLRLGRAPALIARPIGTRATIPFFTLRYNQRALNLRPGERTARLRNARLIPTPRALRLIRQRLGLRQARRLPLAVLASTADLKAFDVPPVEPPPLKPLPPDPQPLARPATAVDIASSEIVWCVRASWVRYMNTELAPVHSNGAVPGAPVTGAEACDKETTDPNSSAMLHYQYSFAPRAAGAGGPGWYDPQTETAALYFSGGVHYRYPTNGIDLQFNDPEIELAGPASRQIFRFVGSDATAIPNHRVVMADLNLAAATLTEGPAGTFTSGEMHASFTQVASESVFGGLYPTGGPAGWVQVKFTIPQPTS